MIPGSIGIAPGPVLHPAPGPADFPKSGCNLAEFPSLPLWTDAYLADTGHLSDAQNGLYLRILILIWRSPQCKIPNNDAWISHKLERSAELFRPLLEEFCRSDGNWITQKRLLKEWKWVKKKSKSNSDAAKARWNKENTKSVRNANAMPPHPTHTHTNGIESKKEEILRFNGVGTGKGDTVTIQNPITRIIIFSKKLHPHLGREPDRIVDIAMHPAHPEHAKCLALCKDAARAIGKGWPKNWPQQEL